MQAHKKYCPSLHKCQKERKGSKVKFNFKKSIIPVLLSVVTVAGLAGSLSGSLAWWAYSTRTAISFQGTSVSTSVRLEIGLKVTDFDSQDKIDALNSVGLYEDEDLYSTYIESGHTHSTRYFFATAGAGLSTNEIATYLLTEGIYAVDELYPVTSSGFTINQVAPFELHESILAGNTGGTDIAPKNKYVRIPFVFRVANYNSSAYYADQNIWLTDVMTEKNPSSPITSQLIENALRVYFDNGTDKIILNPSDMYSGNEVQKTATFGALDLNDDGFYDSDVSGNEIIYGEYSVPDPTALERFTPDSESATNSDINDTGATDHTTFLAKHPVGKNCYENYNGIVGTYAEYKTLAQIAPTDTSGVYSGGVPLVTTTDNAFGKPMGELEMLIWLEGWDHSVIDDQIGGIFNLGLRFEINLIN